MTYLIAELGSNHGGDLAAALDLVDVAAATGCDAAKAQWCSDPQALAKARSADDYVDAYRLLAFRPDWLESLAARAQQCGIDFLCTAFLPEDIPVVAPLVARFKVASFEAHDPDFIAAHAGYGKRCLVSTGMMTTPEVLSLPHRGLIEAVLHCVSAYPTPREQANLGAIRTLADLLGPSPTVGYSDHTADPLTGAFAVCAGAQVLEVHYRNWSTPADLPDYRVSLDPGQLAEYVRHVRAAEAAMGDGVKRPQAAEAESLRYRRR